MALNPCLVGLIEEGDGAHGGGCDELDGEDGIDLADELVADVDRRFGHGTSKLDRRTSESQFSKF
jgi:hypothetical protein